MHVRRIMDPVYLARQPVVSVPEHQVKSLLPHIRSMVVLCRKYNLGSMTAPEAGLNYNFFIAKDPDPRARDFDACFDPVCMPVEGSGTVTLEEPLVDGGVARVKRWRTVNMSWKYHDGEIYEHKSGTFEGEVAYIAQRMCERLSGVYISLRDDGNVV